MGTNQQLGLGSDDTDADAESMSRRPALRARTWVMFGVSLALLVGAGYFVYSASDGLTEQWESVRAAPWWMLGLILLGPIGNHISVSMCLHSLQSRHGKLGVREMFVLIGSAWLLNSYLPMRPGLIGRMGYHKKINKIRLRDSLESSVWSGVLSGVSNSTLLIIAFIMTRYPGGLSIALPAVPVVLWFILSTMMPGRKSTLVMRALGYRQMDVVVWLGRYYLAFHVLGLDLSIGDVALISAVSQFATLIPLTGGGLGFREWSVGLIASAVGGEMNLAVLADMINRGAETLIVVPVGLLCTWIVARWWTRHRSLLVVEGLAEDDAGSGGEHEDQAGDAGEQDPSEG